MTSLAHHRAYTTIGKKHPLENLTLLIDILERKLMFFVVMLNKVQKNRPSFKNLEVVPGAINKGRDTPIRIDFDKPIFLLLGFYTERKPLTDS